jgi:hypothetical protein
MRIQQTAISVADPDAEYPELSGHPDPYYYIKYLLNFIIFSGDLEFFVCYGTILVLNMAQDK